MPPNAIASGGINVNVNRSLISQSQPEAVQLKNLSEIVASPNYPTYSENAALGVLLLLFT